ncbi:MAG: response regulator [Phycisphaeraceae bacterium]|nr:response regulator [Phycisphaeraceae bacterium]
MMTESKSQPFRLSLTATPVLAGRNVLLIDDQPPFNLSVASVLRDAGAAVRFASDANQVAFRCHAAIESSQPFDLVIVRLVLDHDSGPHLCRLLREQLYHGPILALGDMQQQNDALEAGADLMLDPTAGSNQLLDAAVNLLQQPAREIQSPDELPDDFQPVVSDLAAFPQMQQMLACFVEQLPQRISEMLDAARLHDLAQLEKLIGDLKRSAGSHGFVAISREAAETERELQSTPNDTSEPATQSGDLSRTLDNLSALCRRAVVRSDRPTDLPPTA